MDKKQKISWGVSFGSLALVAGMVSYLGLSSGEKPADQIADNQNLPANGQSQNDFGFQQDRGPRQNFNSSFDGDNSSDMNENDETNTNGEQSSNDSNQQDQFSNGGPSFGHHGGFDTTTGGT